MYGDEGSKNSEDGRGADEHYEEPEVELEGGPVVFRSDLFNDDAGGGRERGARVFCVAGCHFCGCGVECGRGGGWYAEGRCKED